METIWKPFHYIAFKLFQIFALYGLSQDLPGGAVDKGSIPGPGRFYKPVHQNWWACTLEPKSQNYWAREPRDCAS